MPRLTRKFFDRNTVTVAKELLGKYLVRRIHSTRSGQAAKVIAARITETEAYCGQKDLACHASRGLTERTKVMFGPPGYAYVYLVYGIYHCLNVVTEKEGYPAAILIRGCELADGPGKLCRELGINMALNSVDLCSSKELWLEDREEKPPKIKKGKRIGVDYAGKWKDKLWRFCPIHDDIVES